MMDTLFLARAAKLIDDKSLKCEVSKKGSHLFKLASLTKMNGIPHEKKHSSKGDVLATARIAGIMGAKSTAQLIPMCHPINLDNVGVELHLDEDRSTVEISAIVKTTSKTGVEMEAMTAVSVAALTVYDMCKRGDRGIRIGDIR